MKLPSRRFAIRTTLLLASIWANSVAAQSHAASATRTQTPGHGARTCDVGELHAHLAADPRRVAIADGRVSLIPPAGMQALTPTEIAQALQNHHELVFDNGVSAQIYLRFSAGDVFVDSPRYRQELERMIESNDTDVTWISREVVELGGARWLRFEFTGRRNGIERHVQFYETGFQGRTLNVLFISGSNDAARWKEELARSAATLEVKDCVLPGGQGTESSLGSASPSPGQAVVDSVRVYELHEIDVKPQAIGADRMLERNYPPALRDAGIAGLVEVRLRVDPQGQPHDFSIRYSSSPEFNDPTIKSLRRTRFTPARKDGETVHVWVTIPVRWTPPSYGKNPD